MSETPYCHWAYFTDADGAKRCAATLEAAGYLCLVDDPGFDPWTVGRPVEPSATEWTLRAAKPIGDDEDLVKRHDKVERIIRQHTGTYDGGEATIILDEATAAELGRLLDAEGGEG